MPEPLEIAVVGAGVSGLVAAWRLGEHHRVTLFEARSRPGGHVNTVEVETSAGIQPVDTGFIVFNREDYPGFTRILDELGIASRPSEMSLGVRCDASGVEWCGARSANRIFGQRGNLARPAFWRMLAEIARFAREAHSAPATSVGEFLRARHYGRAFRELYLLPLGSALWSCSERDFAAFPLGFVADFLARYHLLDPIAARPLWRTIEGGAARYVKALLARFRGELRLSEAIERVRRDEGRVWLATADGATLAFDEVVLACHAEQSLALLEAPSATEKAILSSFPDTENTAVLHTDTRVLARNRRCRGAWNVHRRAGRADNGAKVAVTYNMNLLQDFSSRETYCVSLNETGIAPEKIIARMRYRHPRFTLAQHASGTAPNGLLRSNRTSYCGAWRGFGFHEDGVASAAAVVRAFGLPA